MNKRMTALTRLFVYHSWMVTEFIILLTRTISPINPFFYTSAGDGKDHRCELFLKNN